MIVAQERGDGYLAMAIVKTGNHTPSILCVHSHPHPSSGVVKVQDAFQAGTAAARGELMRSCWTMQPSWRRSCPFSAAYPAASAHLSSTSLLTPPLLQTRRIQKPVPVAHSQPGSTSEAPSWASCWLCYSHCRTMSSGLFLVATSPLSFMIQRPAAHYGLKSLRHPFQSQSG